MDIDDLCNTFAVHTKLIDAEQEWENLIDLINKLNNNEEIRKNMEKAFTTLERFNLTFIKDLDPINTPYIHISEIQECTKQFLNMWIFFVKNELQSTPSDLILLKDNILKIFNLIQESVEQKIIDDDREAEQEADREAEQDGSTDYCTENEKKEWMEYYYDEYYADVSTDYEDLNK